MSAKFITEEKEIVEMIEVKKKISKKVGVQLDLTLEQAQMLYTLTGELICGIGARDYTDDIYRQLNNLGFRPYLKVFQNSEIRTEKGSKEIVQEAVKHLS